MQQKLFPLQIIKKWSLHYVCRCLIISESVWPVISYTVAMPRPLATLRCTIPARKSLSEPTAKRKHKKKRNLKIKKEIKSNILIRVPNVSEIYFLPFSEIRVG